MLLTMLRATLASRGETAIASQSATAKTAACRSAATGEHAPSEHELALLAAAAAEPAVVVKLGITAMPLNLLTAEMGAAVADLALFNRMSNHT